MKFNVNILPFNIFIIIIIFVVIMISYFIELINIKKEISVTNFNL